MKFYDARKLQTAAIAALLFYIVSSPITYTLTQNVLGGYLPIADAYGCPTGIGLIVHTVVYGAVTYAIMVAY